MCFQRSWNLLSDFDIMKVYITDMVCSKGFRVILLFYFLFYFVFVKRNNLRIFIHGWHWHEVHKKNEKIGLMENMFYTSVGWFGAVIFYLSQTLVNLFQ